MAAPGLTRRVAAAAGAAALLGRPASAQAPARWTGRQFHNQPEDSHVHRFLVELWDGVAEDTEGALRVQVFAQNAGVSGSDPGALDMLISGELQFFTLMGGILGRHVPVADIQGLPFAFSRYDQVDRANAGPLGRLIGRECAARGLHRFLHGTFENGFRQIAMADRPIRSAQDLVGVRMRVPDGDMFRDFFEAMGALPVTVNIAGLYAALRDHRVDGQENPLAVTEVNRLYEVTRYVSITDHMWSGFNLLANKPFWDRLPPEVRAVANRRVAQAAARQRLYTRRFNAGLAVGLERRGMAVNRVDRARLRAAVPAEFYRRWRERLGRAAWRLLADAAGPPPA